MAASGWVGVLKSAQKTCIIQDGRRKIHFVLPDGVELVEEYDIKTHDLLSRKWKRRGALGGEGSWDCEVGEEPAPIRLTAEGLIESSSNPIVVRKDTLKAFQWRIRNLPYPIENYNVTLEDEHRHIVIRTTNKKYFKKLAIPDLERCKIALEQSRISIAHANNTLIVTYEKPSAILEMEKLLHDEFKKTKPMKEGDMECNPS